MKILFAVGMIGALAACGGKKHEDTTTSGTTIDNNTHGDTTDHSGSMIPPEKMDQVLQLLNRKGTAVSRCLTMVVDNKELPKNSRGKLTLGITISPAGKATTVKLISTTLESKPLEECVTAKVR